ncbi:hypothetical protein ACQCN2_21695 [Brevibacillus ginsengisoli]|uniref:hypothetical protein n=1 Tax=Brevibacillus ginsengisoli TaxID=363854 RepID=UPI003CEEA515
MKKVLTVLFLMSLILNSFAICPSSAGAKTISVSPTNVVHAPDPGGGGAGGDWQEVGRYNVRLDPPRAYTDQKYHVHVYEKSGDEVGVEACDGTESHGKTLDDGKLSKKDIEKVRNSDIYKKGAKKQQKLKDALKAVAKKNYDLNDDKQVTSAANMIIAMVGDVIIEVYAISQWRSFLRAAM